MLFIANGLRESLELILLLNFRQLSVERLELRGYAVVFAFEVDAANEFVAGEQGGYLFVAEALIDLLEEAEIVVELAHELGQRSALELCAAFAVADDHSLRGALDHHLDEVAVVLDVLLELALLDAIERRLRDVDMAALDELLHVTEEEGQQKGANVGAVDVGVGHQDDLAVAELGGVEVILADTAAEGGDHGADFFVAQHLVVAGLLHVEDLSLEGQDGLEA